MPLRPSLPLTPSILFLYHVGERGEEEKRRRGGEGLLGIGKGRSNELALLGERSMFTWLVLQVWLTRDPLETFIEEPSN